MQLAGLKGDRPKALKISPVKCPHPQTHTRKHLNYYHCPSLQKYRGLGAAKGPGPEGVGRVEARWGTRP